MIGILDEIEVATDNLAQLQQIITDRYLPGAKARGMALTRSWVSPPVALSRTPTTLRILWEVDDIGAWYKMRFTAAFDQSVTAGWNEVDKLCIRRERHYLMDGEPGQPNPELLGPLTTHFPRILTANGMRDTAQLMLRKSASNADIEAWERALRAAPDHIEGLTHIFLARNLEGSFGAGDFTFDAHYVSLDAQLALSQHKYLLEVLQPLQMRVIEHELRMGTQLLGGGLRAPTLNNGIKRTAYFRLLPNTPPEIASKFEDDLLTMPDYISSIRNWSLSRAIHSSWSYVWEQEFDRVEDLHGEYMLHPYHWSHVDKWFDPELSQRIIDTNISHAFCPIERSVLSRSLST